MGAEIFDVVLDFDGVIIAHADKVSIKKNKDSSSKNTFDGDVTFLANNTGGTISITHIVWPRDVDDAMALENKLNSNDLKTIKCIANGYTVKGDKYKRVITGLNPRVTSDDEDWSPTDGVSASLELSCEKLEKTARKA